MSKVEKGSVKFFILQAVATSIAGMILWPLLDLLFSTIFSQSDFAYSIANHVVEPIIFGLFVSFAFWISDRRIKRKKK